MVSPTLGKRTRSSRGTSEQATTFELPAKRTRRTLRSAAIAEEPEAEKENDIVIAEDDDANDETGETQEAKTTWREKNLKDVQKTPSKSLARQASVASTVKSSAIPPVTPSTPRHYDALKGVATTPRHRVMSVGKFSKRMTPSTPLTPSSVQTVYHQARQLFSRSADPGQLIGRDDERAQMKKFLSRCTTSKPSGCLYVSGPPGTGKSAMVNRITDETVSESSDSSNVKKAYINCMSIKSSKDLYYTLLDQLVTPEDQETDLSETDVVEALQKLFIPKKNSASSKVYLIVLDEIDHILTLDPESLYRVFEWSLQPTGSRLLMIGIANALDLTDRFLPRLKSRNLKPEILPFLPYTAPQVKNIITTRLKTLLPHNHPDKTFVPFFHPAAIELCSRKVSTQTGDLRRAFEVCRRAIDLVELETRLKYENEIKENLLQMSPSRKVLGEKHNLATPKAGVPPSQSVTAGQLIRSLQSLTVETAPRVSIGHLNKVTAAAFSNGTAQRLKVLNLQQKAALCSLLAIEKRNRENVAAAVGTPTSKNRLSGAPTVRRLFESYAYLCKTDSVLHPLSSVEFREVISSLETLSLIAEVDGKLSGSLGSGGGGLARTPSRRGKKKKDVFGMGDMKSGLLADERRVAACVGYKEMEGVDRRERESYILILKWERERSVNNTMS
ncbi:putative cell division control protein [Triangularia verruculosa]|uniref:Cell division control protein n=1 Tax=Triangularia verruculosa TaxID=2587418 RepID=A0AAN6XPN5_9PEZI|nr:putative cell division control protein [Triangularia verruculosa]